MIGGATSGNGARAPKGKVSRNFNDIARDIFENDDESSWFWELTYNKIPGI